MSSLAYQYPTLMTRQHSDAPRNSRVEYKFEIQRLNEVNAHLTTEAQGLRERITYLENLAVSWADLYAASQRDLSNTEAKAENAVTTWFNTRTWLDEAQASLATTKQQLADASNELTQTKIERKHLEHQLVEQTRATNDALHRSHAAQQEVAALNGKLFQFTTRWAELVDRTQKEAIGRQAAEQALHAERQYSHQLREAAKQAIAEAQRQRTERDEVEADLQLVRQKNEVLVAQMGQVYSYMDQINYDLAEDINAPQPAAPAIPISSFTTLSPPPLTDSDGSSSSEPSQPSSPLPSSDAQPFSFAELTGLAAGLEEKEGKEEEGFTLMGEDPEEIIIPSFPPFVSNPPVVINQKTGLTTRDYAFFPPPPEAQQSQRSRSPSSTTSPSQSPSSSSLFSSTSHSSLFSSASQEDDDEEPSPLSV